MNDSISSQSSVKEHYSIEQYKILIDSLNQLNNTRENANNFWMGINGFGISAIAYLRDIGDTNQYKFVFLITMSVVGLLFCLSWLSYLRTIKESIEVRSRLLIELERELPMTLFTKIFARSSGQPGKSTLTLKEMLVPSLFIAGYIFFSILIVFFPEAVASTTSHP